MNNVVLPKREIQDIQLQINNRVLGTEQYEFICLRLIDSVKQLEEKINRYENALKEIAYEPCDDLSWNEIAVKYEVIADKALNEQIKFN